MTTRSQARNLQATSPAAVPGVKAASLIAGGFFAVILFAVFIQPQPSPKTATAPAPAASAEPEIDYSYASYEGQLMSDYRVGKVVGEIKCGKRPARDGIDLLNLNGVPPALLEAPTPAMRKGFQSVWC